MVRMLLRLSAAVILICGSMSTSVFCAQVTVDRILREHNIFVVTTEPGDEVNKHVFNLGITDHTLMAPCELLTRSKRLGSGDSILFAIDRSKAKRMIDEEKQLLPCPSSAVNSDEVLVYARKANGRNGWEILVTAPSQKWLFHALERLGSASLSTLQIDADGTTLERYRVRQLLIVSTEGPQFAEEWVSRQLVPGQDVLDWEHLDVDSWEEARVCESNTLFLVNSQEIGNSATALLNAMPDELQRWYDAGSGSQIAAVKQILQHQTDSEHTICGIMAPCKRQLGLAALKYRSLEAIPVSLETTQLSDLSRYRPMIVVVEGSPATPSADATVLDELQTKMSSALTSRDTGFQYANPQTTTGAIVLSDKQAFRSLLSEVGTPCVVALVKISAMKAATSYSANSPACITSPYPQFDEPEPQKPQKPDPDQVILFKGHKYRIVDGSRKNDPHYKEDLEEYYEDLEDYYDDHRRWERHKDDDEYSRRRHEMEWRTSVDAIQSASLSGDVQILTYTQASSPDTGQLVLSCSLDGKSEQRDEYSSETTTIMGEDNIPQRARAPEAVDGVSDSAVISEALDNACKQALADLLEHAILPRDTAEGLGRPKPLNAQQEVTAEPCVEASSGVAEMEQIGAVKLTEKPAGTGVKVARDAALLDACRHLAQRINGSTGDKNVSEEEVRKRSEIVSEGWNPSASEYRVRIVFPRSAK